MQESKLNATYIGLVFWMANFTNWFQLLNNLNSQRFSKMITLCRVVVCDCCRGRWWHKFNVRIALPTTLWLFHCIFVRAIRCFVSSVHFDLFSHSTHAQKWKCVCDAVVCAYPSLCTIGWNQSSNPKRLFNFLSFLGFKFDSIFVSYALNRVA